MITTRSLAFRVSAFIVAILFTGAAYSTAALAKPKPKPAQKESPAAGPKGGGQVSKLGQFDDWTAYATPSGRKTCYALSVPKERLPKNLNRDPGYVFVSYRPDEKVRGEIAFVMGFAVKEDTPAQALLGSTSFELAGKDASLFVRNAAQEGAMLAAMKKGGNLVVKASSKRGNATSDRYSLAGIAQAIDRAEKECK